MFMAEKLIRSLVEKYGRHTIYTDGGTRYDEVCNVIGLKHYLHSSLEKSLMERVNQYLKDRLNCLTIITIHVLKINAIFFMYKTGYNSFSIYNDITFKN